MGPWRNFYLTGAQELRNGVARSCRRRARPRAPTSFDACPLDMFLDYLGVRLNGERAAGKTVDFTIELTDTNDQYAFGRERRASLFEGQTHRQARRFAGHDARRVQRRHPPPDDARETHRRRQGEARRQPEKARRVRLVARQLRVLVQHRHGREAMCAICDLDIAFAVDHPMTLGGRGRDAAAIEEGRLDPAPRDPEGTLGAQRARTRAVEALRAVQERLERTIAPERLAALPEFFVLMIETATWGNSSARRPRASIQLPSDAPRLKDDDAAERDAVVVMLEAAARRSPKADAVRSRRRRRARSPSMRTMRVVRSSSKPGARLGPSSASACSVCA